MTDEIKKLVSHFYDEALKYEVNSTNFLKSAKHVSNFYRDYFGMNQTWLDYHQLLTNDDQIKAKSLFNLMYTELLKL